MYVLYGFLHTFFICIYTQFDEQLSLQSPARHVLYAKKGRPVMSLPFENPERKGQDSNLRTSFAGYTLSRRASSTTRAPFLVYVSNACGFKSGAKINLRRGTAKFFPEKSAFPCSATLYRVNKQVQY